MPDYPVQRVRPTLTSNDLIRGRSLGQPRPVPTGAPIDGPAVSTYSPRPMAVATAPAPRPIAPVARAPRVEDMAGMSDLGRESYLANNGIYAPGSVGAMNAQTNGTAYNPPQQTERANPLSGDNNRPMEGQTTAIARPPFIQRGAGIPGGQDAAPVRQTLSQDDDIATSMQGTMDRLRPSVSGADIGSGRYARRFGAPAAQNAYDSLLKRILKPSA